MSQKSSCLLSDVSYDHVSTHHFWTSDSETHADTQQRYPEMESVPARLTCPIVCINSTGTSALVVKCQRFTLTSFPAHFKSVYAVNRPKKLNRDKLTQNKYFCKQYSHIHMYVIRIKINNNPLLHPSSTCTQNSLCFTLCFPSSIFCRFRFVFSLLGLVFGSWPEAVWGVLVLSTPVETAGQPLGPHFLPLYVDLHPGLHVQNGGVGAERPSLGHHSDSRQKFFYDKI